MKLFYDQKFKMQCFIYLKYRERWPKRWIKKYLFLTSERSYYGYVHKSKDIIKEDFGSE